MYLPGFICSITLIISLLKSSGQSKVLFYGMVIADRVVRVPPSGKIL